MLLVVWIVTNSCCFLELSVLMVYNSPACNKERKEKHLKCFFLSLFTVFVKSFTILCETWTTLTSTHGQNERRDTLGRLGASRLKDVFFKKCTCMTPPQNTRNYKLALIKVPLWWNFWYPFYPVGLPYISCKISIYYEVKSARFLDFYFCKSTAVINFPCSNFFVENWSKWHHIRKNTAGIEIIITMSVRNCTNTGAKVFALFRAKCCTNYYNFNLGGIFENMTSLTSTLNEMLE